MSALKIMPLGGMGCVTQNMFLYVYQDEILVIDCGIGFPDHYMPGVDILIPDIHHLQKLLESGKKIVGMVLTHGHDDHIGALPYLLSEMPEDFTIYGSPLTIGFAEKRMEDGEVTRPTQTIKDRKPVKIGQHFEITAFAMTHSVPDTKHFTIKTPAGMVFHGTDFKLDKNPVDGVEPDYEAFEQLGQQKNIDLMLLDCLRVERDKWTPSESTTGPAIEKVMAKTTGKYVFTSMSSHLHRLQQTIDAAKKHGRKVTFIGWSVEKNVEVAERLDLLNIPPNMKVDKYDLDQYPDSELCIIIAGSQGQEGSSLVRAIFGEHRAIQITPDDTVVFSADAIPGNEVNYYESINELARNGIHMLYPDIMPNLHQSGHASAPEQRKMVELIKSKHLMPIGGDDRHRVKFGEFVAQPLGYSPQQVWLPEDGETVYLQNGEIKVKKEFQIRPQMVDGKGIGDVGPVVLSDRRALSEAGIIVIVMPRLQGKLNPEKILVVSRGFVFMKEADEVIDFIKQETAKQIKKYQAKKQQPKEHKFRQQLERHLSRELYKIIKREPLILPVVYSL